MLEHSVKELSGEVERTHMLQLERVLTCVSEASKEACWRRRQPDLDRDAAKVQDVLADKP